MNTKYLVGIGALGIICVVLMSGCIQQKQTPSQSEEEFILTENNFEFISVSHSPEHYRISSKTLDKICADYKAGEKYSSYVDGERVDYTDYQKNTFIMTHRLDGPRHYPVPEEPGAQSIYFEWDCYVIVDGIKYYHTWNHGESGINELHSTRFCDDPNCKDFERSKCCNPARVDITKDTDITLCANGICKTKTLPAYCK